MTLIQAAQTTPVPALPQAHPGPNLPQPTLEFVCSLDVSVSAPIAPLNRSMGCDELAIAGRLAEAAARVSANRASVGRMDISFEEQCGVEARGR